jgi:hypothetical protein
VLGGRLSRRVVVQSGERGLQVGIILQILTLVEVIGLTALELSECDVVLERSTSVGPEGLDQVAIARQALPRIEILGRRLVRPALLGAELDVLDRGGAPSLVALAIDRTEIAVVCEILGLVEGVGLTALELAELQVMLASRLWIGAEGLGEITIARDVLQAVEIVREIVFVHGWASADGSRAEKTFQPGRFRRQIQSTSPPGRALPSRPI